MESRLCMHSHQTLDLQKYNNSYIKTPVGIIVLVYTTCNSVVKIVVMGFSTLAKFYGHIYLVQLKRMIFIAHPDTEVQLPVIFSYNYELQSISFTG